MTTMTQNWFNCMLVVGLDRLNDLCVIITGNSFYFPEIATSTSIPNLYLELRFYLPLLYLNQSHQFPLAEKPPQLSFSTSEIKWEQQC